MRAPVVAEVIISSSLRGDPWQKRTAPRPATLRVTAGSNASIAWRVAGACASISQRSRAVSSPLPSRSLVAASIMARSVLPRTKRAAPSKREQNPRTAPCLLRQGPAGQIAEKDNDVGADVQDLLRDGLERDDVAMHIGEDSDGSCCERLVETATSHGPTMPRRLRDLQ